MNKWVFPLAKLLFLFVFIVKMIADYCIIIFWKSVCPWVCCKKEFD
jgi:hypothetical protein